MPRRRKCYKRSSRCYRKTRRSRRMTRCKPKCHRRRRRCYKKRSMLPSVSRMNKLTPESIIAASNAACNGTDVLKAGKYGLYCGNGDYYRYAQYKKKELGVPLKSSAIGALYALDKATGKLPDVLSRADAQFNASSDSGAGGVSGGYYPYHM